MELDSYTFVLLKRGPRATSSPTRSSNGYRSSAWAISER